MKILALFILILVLFGTMACVSTPYDYLRNRDYNGLKKEVSKNNNFVQRSNCKDKNYRCTYTQYFSVVDYLSMYTFTTEQEDAELLSFLIERGAPITNKNFTKYYREPIYRALRKNKILIAKTLIEYNEQLDPNSNKKFDLNNLTYDGSTALTAIAGQRNNNKMIEFLISKGVDVNKKNRYKMSPLDIALGVSNNHVNIDTLLKYKAEYKPKHRLPFNRRSLKNLEVLVNHGINILEDNDYIYYPTYNDIEVSSKLSLYLNSIGAELTIEGNDYLRKIHFLSFMSDNKSIKKTIDLCLEKNKDCKKYLDSSTYFGLTPIVLSAISGNYKLMEYLIEKGANINKQNKFFQTALHIVILLENERAINTLLKHNADINIKDIKNNTAKDLYNKIYNEDISVVQKKLLDEFLKEKIKKEEGKDASTATSPEGKGASTATSLDKKNNVIDLTETKLEDNLNKPSKEETKKEPKKEVEDIEETF